MWADISRPLEDAVVNMLVYNDYHLYGFNALSEAEHKTVQDILNMCIQYPEAHILFKGRRLCQTELEDKKAIILLPEGKEIESIIHNAVNSEQTVKFTNGTLWLLRNNAWLNTPNGKEIKHIPHRSHFDGNRDISFTDGTHGILRFDNTWISPPDGKEIMSISMPYPDGTRMVRFTDKTWLLLTKNTWQALNSPDGKEIIDIYDPGSNGSREIFFSDKTYWLNFYDGTWFTPPEGKEIAKIHASSSDKSRVIKFTDETYCLFFSDRTLQNIIPPRGKTIQHISSTLSPFDDSRDVSFTDGTCWLLLSDCTWLRFSQERVCAISDPASDGSRLMEFIYRAKRVQWLLLADHSCIYPPEGKEIGIIGELNSDGTREISFTDGTRWLLINGSWYALNDRITAFDVIQTPVDGTYLVTVHGTTHRVILPQQSKQLAGGTLGKIRKLLG